MKKHFRYLSYILRHKWFVFVAGLQVGAPIWRLVIHDWSKFLPSEWVPYAQKFYGNKPPNPHLKLAADAAFNVAWLKHQHRNPHHWQHWLLAEDNPAKRLETPQSSGSPRSFPLPMPEKFVREMVADWMGAGRAITGRWGVLGWYDKNESNLVLHPETQALVLLLLPDTPLSWGGYCRRANGNA